ncbi:AAA domain-containing protein [Pseudanabaena sp. FACHB-2040]|uniref:DEAD/DEAH box helicase n=1 Tax=Pseudanabaena sp. FACHB-2040 TaxID=2692859 RepID=UPI001686588F|nr:AAA domain-containing protein [Pseudanabaena sp. FACHB-2040]MBD2261231.1 AAA family ATPase [Pseudanabaena sp. FACHB-2040]
MAIEGYLAQFRIALDDEIAKLRGSGGQRIYLTGGRYLSKRSNGKYLYAFVADNEVRFQDETPIELEQTGREGKVSTKGLLVSVDGFDITLALEKKIGDTVPAATLNTSPIFLLEALQESFRAALQPQSKANLRLAEMLIITGAEPSFDKTGEANELLTRIENRFNIIIQRNLSQEAAVDKVLSHQASFIWGPPGTGKTTTLGMTVAALVHAGESVLVLSHSNMAVDTAMASIAKFLEKSPLYKQGLILRHGVPIPNVLDDYPMLRAKKVLKYLEPEFIERIEALEKRKRSLYQQLRNKNNTAYHQQQITQDIDLVDKILKPLREEQLAKEKQLIVRAEVVGCTLSKALISEEIEVGKFDTVIVDEASMVSIPQCVFAATLAKRRIAIYGDFRQLGPITQADTPAAKKWLGRDIFDQSGVMDCVNRNQNDPRMVMLQTQYRMHPSIASIPNRLCYSQRLENGEAVENQNRETVAQPPFPGEALVLQDLSDLMAHCIKETESHSRFNFLSALIAVNTAYQAAKTNELTSIGIITPYNAQSRLIHRMLRDLGISDQVKASTVHRFQGSERNVIVFDAVDSLPQANIGLPLQGGQKSTAMRLANVAISRAQGKFIGVMNVNHIRNKLQQAQFQAFRKFVEYLHNSATINKLTWQSLLNEDQKIILPGVTCFANALEARAALEESLYQASNNIAMYWPCREFDNHFSPGILKVINSKGVGFYISGMRGAEAELNLNNTQVWNNGQSTVTGLIGIDEKSLWIFLNPALENAGVLKLDLPKTVDLLYGFLRLLPHRKTLPNDPYLFGRCTCGAPMGIRTVGKGYLITCLRRPTHPEHRSRHFNPEDAVRVAEERIQLCGSCGSKPVGRRSTGTGRILLVCSSQNCDWMMNLNDLI